MKIIHFHAENFKRLRTVEIAPDGEIVTVGGKNGQGKSSVLDAIYVALKGLSAAPPQPIRAGEEKCHIRLVLGDMVITRTFTRKGGEEYTHTLKVENADGLRYGKPQEVLNDLLGEIGFDPCEFVKMKPDAQAETLLEMVPLRIDLEEFQKLDASDTLKRRDINRDGKALVAQRDAIALEQLPDIIPDREALVARLGEAANINGAIASERTRREGQRSLSETCSSVALGLRDRARELRRQADEADAAATAKEAEAEGILAELAQLPELDQPVDTDEVREALRDADRIAALVDRQTRRAAIDKQVEALRAESEALTASLAERERQRNAALAEARMPIKGLSFHVPETGKPRVYFNGVPFEQASTAEQIRASTAIAMAANPNLRVLRIKDGSLLDEDSMAILREMAVAEDYQLWVEVVGSGGVGIIMEDGAVKEPAAAEGTVEQAQPVAELHPKGKTRSAPPADKLL